jgi:hypothetical protein
MRLPLFFLNSLKDVLLELIIDASGLKRRDYDLWKKLKGYGRRSLVETLLFPMENIAWR